MSWLSKRREAKLKRDWEEERKAAEWAEYVDASWKELAVKLNVADDNYKYWRRLAETIEALPIAHAMVRVLEFTEDFNSIRGRKTYE